MVSINKHMGNTSYTCLINISTTTDEKSLYQNRVIGQILKIIPVSLLPILSINLPFLIPQLNSLIQLYENKSMSNYYFYHLYNFYFPIKNIYCRPLSCTCNYLQDMNLQNKIRNYQVQT